MEFLIPGPNKMYQGLILFKVQSLTWQQRWLSLRKNYFRIFCHVEHSYLEFKANKYSLVTRYFLVPQCNVAIIYIWDIALFFLNLLLHFSNNYLLVLHSSFCLWFCTSLSQYQFKKKTKFELVCIYIYMYRYFFLY